MSLELIVLNYNGRSLLAECLPSVVTAAARSSRLCGVTVIDNGSSDGTTNWLLRTYPNVRLVHRENRGLCSYNDVVAASDANVVVLLNNDVKLAVDAVDPLVAPLFSDNAAYDADCFLTAPRCLQFDQRTHEGEKTAVRWRWGLVEGTAFFPGFANVVAQSDWTAAAGCVMAVRRDRFVELGGFDPLFLPGRLEDLDLGYRGFAAGWHARYVPSAVSYHRGAASFGPTFGSAGCDSLAWRNTLLFQWKHLRHPWHRIKALAGVAGRIARETALCATLPSAARWQFTRAFRDAFRLRDAARHSTYRAPTSLQRERRFFARFRPEVLANPIREGAP